MSTFICSDEHIATIAVRYGELIGATKEDVQAIADNLLAINVASVNYSYYKDTKVEPCDLDACTNADLSFSDLIALCECLDYQSCELPEYSNPLLDAITAQFKANDRSGIKSPLWSI